MKEWLFKTDSLSFILPTSSFRLAFVVFPHKPALWHATLFDVDESLRMRLF